MGVEDYATQMGVDLHSLWDERFSGPRHGELLALHEERIERWETMKSMERFEGTLHEIGQIYREKEALRRARISAAKTSREYDFPDELLQIALRTIDAKDRV